MVLSHVAEGTQHSHFPLPLTRRAFFCTLCKDMT